MDAAVEFGFPFFQLAATVTMRYAVVMNKVVFHAHNSSSTHFSAAAFALPDQQEITGTS